MFDVAASFEAILNKLHTLKEFIPVNNLFDFDRKYKVYSFEYSSHFFFFYINNGKIQLGFLPTITLWPGETRIECYTLRAITSRKEVYQLVRNLKSLELIMTCVLDEKHILPLTFNPTKKEK